MPRRTATPATPAPPAPLPPPPRDLDALDQSDPEWAANLRTLRRHWKWANFSQFFYTFADLLAVPDVFLSVSIPTRPRPTRSTRRFQKSPHPAIFNNH